METFVTNASANCSALNVHGRCVGREFCGAEDGVALRGELWEGKMCLAVHFHVVIPFLMRLWCASKDAQRMSCLQ